MTAPVIPPLPAAPSPSDTLEQFDEKAFPFVAALSPTVAAINASTAYVNQRADDAEHAAEKLEDPVVEAVVNNIDAIVAVNANKTNIDNVAGNASNIDAVAGNASNINTVASSKANIDIVAPHTAAVESVADNISSVTSVASNKTNIDNVAGNAANISAVADNETNINAVAGNASNINTVADAESNVDTVAARSADIETVASISTQVQAVASIDDEVVTAADNAAAISAVANDLPAINIAAGSVVEIGIVAADISAVTTAAANIGAIQDAPGAASAAAQSASEAAQSEANAAQSAQDAADVVLGQVFDDDIVSEMFGWSSDKISTELGEKQSTLKSGENIKTVGGKSIVGEGNVPIPAHVALDGPTAVPPNGTETYTITNYSAFSTYSVLVTAGTASISGNTITFNAPASEQTITLTVTVDGNDADFAVEVLSPYIATPAATPANFGDAFEGGFYAGMIWNELIQSNTETTIGTGAKTFNCPTLTRAVTYIGHEVEIRSRADPSNNMVATVTASSLGDKTITVNVTSINGSGTFNDWSIMSRYRMIVAPKASGENASIAIKNADTPLPIECQTLTEGWRATNAMVAAGTSTVYPAAHWARGLSVGGFDDWHIPARDELELCWRNLKPITDNNNTGTRSSSSFDYANNGAYADSTSANGVNSNSSPVGSAYTTTSPGQTAVVAFRTGGVESFGSFQYKSSSAVTESTGHGQGFSTGSNAGRQYSFFNSGAGYVRAIRRSII